MECNKGLWVISLESYNEHVFVSEVNLTIERTDPRRVGEEGFSKLYLKRLFFSSKL